MAHAQSRGGQDYEASKYVGWRTRKYDIMIVLIFFLLDHNTITTTTQHITHSQAQDCHNH